MKIRKHVGEHFVSAIIDIMVLGLQFLPVFIVELSRAMLLLGLVITLCFTDGNVFSSPISIPFSLSVLMKIRNTV